MIKNLKALRKQKGMSQQLASLLQISQQAVNKYENHNIEPDIATLIAMADIFGVTLDRLVGRAAEGEIPLVLIPREREMLSRYRAATDSVRDCVDKLLRP